MVNLHIIEGGLNTEEGEIKKRSKRSSELLGGGLRVTVKGEKEYH